MRLSVVIVNWNTTRLLEECLRSITEFAPSFEFEQIVVDNASSDFDEARFSSEFPHVRLVRNIDNAGYAKANNQAIALSTGGCVLLLNPDTRVTAGALESLVGFLESHPEAAAVGGKLVRPDGSVERSVRSFPYPGPIAWEYIGLSNLFPQSTIFGSYRMTYFAYDKVSEVDQPMGSCLMMARRALDDVGPLDESFPIFFNEVDWLYRAKKKGYKAYFTPDAVVIHHGGAGTRQAGRRRMARESHDSLLRFYRKHFRGEMPAPVYHFTVACIAVSRLLRG